MSKSVVVQTKQQLAAACESGAQEIVVKGELAKRLKDGKKIRKVGAGTLAALGSAIIAFPFTGGLSASMALSISASTGVGTALVLAAILVGLSLLLAVWKEYDEIDYSHSPLSLSLRRKKKR